MIMNFEPCESLEFPPSAFTKREEETFEDYTAVTDWERFVQALENLLTRWELRADGDPAIRQSLLSSVSFSPNGYLCGRLYFGEREFQLVYFSGLVGGTGSGVVGEEHKRSSIPQVLDASDNHFHGHVLGPIAGFGLSHALVLRPTEGEISGATRLNLLLSSAEMAVHAVRCPLPVLVCYSTPAYCYGVAAIPPLPTSGDGTQDETKHEYQASVLTGALNIDFSVGKMDGSVNPTCTHLDGLRELFLRKLGYPWKMNCPIPEVTIAARFIYPLPYWPEFTEVQHSFPLFSFDLAPLSSVFPQFHLAAVWPKVPSHAIMQRPSWTVLKPEGAPEWYLQLFLQTSHADRMSSRLKSFLQSCLYIPEPEVNRPAARTFSTITSRLSWLGADLPRLRSILGRSTPQSTHEQPTSPEYKLLGEQVIHHLLFLFPDADANFSSSSTLANELITNQPTSPDQSELLNWSRTQNRASAIVAQLTNQFNLPPATSLTHRLAVLLCNLNYLEPHPSSDSLVEIMYNEFLLELKLRLDRLISLPATKSFEESEQRAVAGLDSACERIESRGATFTPRRTFASFSEQERCNLHLVLEHFNFYIEKACAARSATSSSDSEFEDSCDTVKKEEKIEEVDGKPATEDTFFDAIEDLPELKSDSVSPPAEQSVDSFIISPEEASEEARSILQWLHSLDLARLLRLLMPSVCLEALITFHSLELHPRLNPWYRRELGTLKVQLQMILDRLSPIKSNLDGYANWEERIAHTFSEAFSLLAQFSSRLTCLRQLLAEFTLHVTPFVSDECLSFLCDLASNSVCGITKWRSHLPGWIKVDRQSRTFNDLQSLFGSVPDSESSSSSPVEHFHFTSSPQTWFSRYPLLDLRQPTTETYVLQAIVGQPNPLASRPGPQRLFVLLTNRSQKKTYDSLSLAGAFSHDTQFF